MGRLFLRLVPLGWTCALVGCGALTSGDLQSAVVLGAMRYGEEQGNIRYEEGHLAIRFEGAQNDLVDAYVQSDDGHALAWVVDSDFQVVGYMDDPFVPTYRAHVQTPLPESGTYYIVFRELSLRPATFTVTLQGTPASGVIGLRAQSAPCPSCARPDAG
jgi:hypothetical protein